MLCIPDDTVDEAKDVFDAKSATGRLKIISEQKLREVFREMIITKCDNEQIKFIRIVY